VGDIRTVDWSALEHADGNAADIPERWERFLSGKERWPEELFLTVCNQGTVFTATRELTPFLIELALSGHAKAPGAVDILGGIVRASGGVLASKALHGALMGRIRHPLTGEPMKAWKPPPKRELASEKAWVEQMQDDVEGELPQWMELLASQDREMRMAAAYLLAGYQRHDDSDEARDAVERAAKKAKDKDERARMRQILEDAEELE
jgi:hypothetical protein